MIAALALGIAFGLAIVVLIELSNRYLPAAIQRRLAVLKRAYLAPLRRIVPDRVYRLWYETGLMDAESYRWFQERGYIRDDLDPAYIQRTHTSEDSETGGEQS